jgi:RimJ/RimL family protein N-acetyltransferase
MSASGLPILRAYKRDEAAFLFERLKVWLPDEIRANPGHWRDVVHKRVAESGRWSNDGALDYAIEIDGRLVGAVQAQNGLFHLPPNVYELGIELYETADHGHGLGTAVLHQFIPQVFQHSALRLQGHTHIENEPMRRLFRRFGFVHEGILQDYWPLPDRCGDVALYALTARNYANLSR